MVLRPRVGRALVLSALVLAGCGPDAAGIPVVKLPVDAARPVAALAVQSRDGRVHASLFDGSWVRLTADGSVWEAAPGPAVKGLLLDHQQGLTLALGADGSWLRAAAGAYAPLEPPVPPLPASFEGQRAVLGRDAQGRLWATAAATSGTAAGGLALHRLEPDAGSAWQVERVPLAIVRHTIPAASPALTAAGRLFYRPLESGLWEVDRAGGAVVERVPCSHPLFRPSHPDYVACQEDWLLAAGRGGELFVLTPGHELWRLPPGSTTPQLAVQGALPGLEVQNELGFNRYAPGGYQLYVDPRDRVWLLFRWGDNVPDDVSYLYLADPAHGDGWALVRKDLPRNLRLSGDGPGPLLFSGSPEDGLLVFRVEG